MGIKHTVNRLFWRGGTLPKNADNNENPVAGNDITEAEKASTGNMAHESGMTDIRQVGSTWEHRHGNLDWHSMSIPHPPHIDNKDMPPVITEIPDSAVAEQPITKKDIFCKFVIQGREKIGETITIDSGRLVFKKGVEYFCVPLSSVIDIKDEDVKIGEFDRDEALRFGIEWTRRTTDKLKFDEKGMLIND